MDGKGSFVKFIYKILNILAKCFKEEDEGPANFPVV